MQTSYLYLRFLQYYNGNYLKCKQQQEERGIKNKNSHTQMRNGQCYT